MRKPLLILVFVIGFGCSTDDCPKFITCETSENPSSCPSGKFYRERVKVNGCCPGCVTLKDEGQSCNSPAECQPGLTCKDGKCQGDLEQACEYYKRFDHIWKKKKYWSPLCLPDGTYSPKQCKGEKMAGKCFCVDKKGQRIFGEEEWSKSEKMTCVCSRMADEMRSKGVEATLHCDRLGNFEPLQCNLKVCWCANPYTGIPYTLMVPLEMMSSLPCYNRDFVGAQYYRKCDSVVHVQKKTASLLRNHGTTGISMVSDNCNFDGSFHRVQSLRTKKRCVYVDNSPITEAVETETANCNCAFDRHVAQLNKIEFMADCHSNGNYRTKQVWNNKEFCVDKDGFHYSNDPKDCPREEQFA